MTEINAAEARKDFFNVLEKVTLYNGLTKVKTKSGNAIIMSEEEFDSLQETFYLMSILGMMDSIKQGINTPISDCVKIEEL